MVNNFEINRTILNQS
jgi:molecular chaperone GrpE (heat shock protein)